MTEQPPSSDRSEHNEEILVLDQQGRPVGTFPNLEAFLEANQAAITEANQHLHPQQAGLGLGDHVVRFLPQEVDGEKQVLAIFGHIYTLDELADHGEPPQIVAEIGRQTSQEHLLYGTWASVIEPGEPGSTHASHLWPISTSLYQHAEANGWSVADFDVGYLAELDTAYQEFLDHAVYTWGTDVIATDDP